MDTHKRILVVDDDERVLFVFHDTLVRLGAEYEIVTARSGRQALDKARELPFDLVITDLRMPDVGGVELTEAIRASNSTTVVIWMTAYGCHRFSTEAARLAVYRCLDKPLEVGEIRRIVWQALKTAAGQSR
jgi:DNA-binding NtrC family response regulator